MHTYKHELPLQSNERVWGGGLEVIVLMKNEILYKFHGKKTMENRKQLDMDSAPE